MIISRDIGRYSAKFSVLLKEHPNKPFDCYVEYDLSTCNHDEIELGGVHYTFFDTETGLEVSPDLKANEQLLLDLDSAIEDYVYCNHGDFYTDRLSAAIDRAYDAYKDGDH